ncbi:MAG: hypothetical protein K8S54_06415 [Spirochaetia bacterium]|nr:hypothetical protein [Spirochaetia bacterium]
MQILFYTRLVLYFILICTPWLHTAVAVPYDAVSRFAFLILGPVMMIGAFYGRQNGQLKWLAGLLAVNLFAITFISGWNRDSWLLVVVALLSYVWTRLVFARITRFPVLASLELFAFAFIYFKILNFARASEDVAQQSARITTILLAGTVIVFAIHACVLYLAAFPQKAANVKKMFLYGGLGAVTFMGIAFVIPTDFVSHNIVLNELEKEPPLNPSPLEGEPMDDREGRGDKPKQPDRNTQNGLPLGDREEKYPSELQGGRGGQGNQNPDQKGGKKPQNGKDPQKGDQSGKDQGKPQSGDKGGQGQQGSQQQKDQDKNQENQSKNQKGPKLEGVPSDQWDNQQQQGEGQGKQKAVMVIASPIQPVYAAESYNGLFTIDKSFQPDPIDEGLNSLARMRLLQTWRSQDEPEDEFRKPAEIFYFSTIELRVLAYRPVAIEPTIQDKRYKPFNLSYLALSRMNVTSPEEWNAAGNLSSVEREQNAFYLSVPKDPRVERMRAKVNEITKGKQFHFQKIEAILRSFKGHKYEMGYDEAMNLDKLGKFLFEDKRGDCTEFSQTAALMGRLAGIPSRAVTGYIASRELQTPAHRGGVYQLRRRIPALQKYKMDDLYLVTTSHHHAWVQFYLPQFGWVDFETTSFAIPPEPKMDPNQQDVIIPMIEEVPQLKEKKFDFPYRFVGKVLLVALVVLLIGLYSYRSLRMAYLGFRAKGSDTRALDSLFRLLIIRMAHEGYDIRPPFATHAEYAERYPRIKLFADQFTSLRFRVNLPVEERAGELTALRTEYAHVKSDIKKPGAIGLLRRVFSLRGLWI